MAFYCTLATRTPVHGLRASDAPAITSPGSRAFTVSCHQNNNNPSPPSISVDRRGMLLGLGGLYGIAGQVAPPAAAVAAAPVPGKLADLPNCHYARSDTIVDYEFPTSMPLRVRTAAHLVDGEYIAKYNEALRRMKALPESHPWNFYTHAKNHAIHVHDNWLFLPWHRFYIYFYERILGKLVDDPTFALPFWNFDTPDGMSVPALFLDPASSLYNPTRDLAHFPPAVLDFWYVYGAGTPRTEEERAERKLENVKEVRKTFRQSLGRAELFMGEAAAAEGDGELGSAGRLDSFHKAIHQWVGPAEAPWMDMGNIHASTKDPVFYSLHANLDRLWQLYRTFRGGGPDFDDEKWLDAAFTFHDDNGQHVRVKARDCLDPLKMGYTYQEVPIPWAGHQPVYVSNVRPKPTSPLVRVDEFGSEPKKLDSAVRILVPRPNSERTNLEAAANLEVLHIRGIDVVPSGPARFDVYICAPSGGGDHAGPDYGEFAGSFVKPFRVHSAAEAEKFAKSPMEGKRRKGSLKLGLKPLLEDMEAENAEKLVVTLVPTDGEITVDEIGIKLLPADRPLLL